MDKHYIYDRIEILLNKAQTLKEKSFEDIYGEFEYTEVGKIVSEIHRYVEELCQEQSIMNGVQQIESVEASMRNIQKLALENNNEVYKKIEYELVPLIKNMRMYFYYFIFIYPDKDKMKKYFENEVEKYFDNPYVEESKRTGRYKYDLSIVIIAYNKLEYTKVCVGYLLKYLPSKIRYELILMNHGSTDGTKEYFEQLNFDKTINIAVNGGGIQIIDRIVEGRYVLKISNDVIVLNNVIENMYQCITSNEKIAWVVATTPNVSNQQDIFGEISDMEEIFRIAAINNVSNERRWEEKIRLCNPIDMYDIEKTLEIIGRLLTNGPGVLFSDDRQSALYRRAGYKMYLAKDSYCYHFGSVTIKDNMENERECFRKGRIEYLKEYGIDPWGYGFVYDSKLFCNLEIEKQGKVNILGINSGLCANIVKLRDSFKEVLGNKNVWITGFIQSREYELDVKSLTDEVFLCGDWSFFDQEPTRLYDYILIENGIEEDLQVLESIYKWKKIDGEILLRTKNQNIRKKLQEKYLSQEIESIEQNYYWIRIQ